MVGGLWLFASNYYRINHQIHERNFKRIFPYFKIRIIIESITKFMKGISKGFSLTFKFE
jgi:hypothetical protein